MSRRLITVLYEDRHAKGEKNYGPHMLLLACVADRTGGSRYALRDQVASIALSGDGNVKRRLRDDGASLGATGPLVAMFDNDKVRSRYPVRTGACKRELLDAVQAEAKGSPVIVLLEQNMEDLLAACCAALKRATLSAKPKPMQRDSILQAAAADGQGAARAAILAAMPSFKRLVDVVHALLTGDAG